MKDKKLKFAKDHRHWTTEDWSKMLFSDESSIQWIVVRKHNVCRRIGKCFDPKYTVATSARHRKFFFESAIRKSATEFQFS